MTSFDYSMRNNCRSLPGVDFSIPTSHNRDVEIPAQTISVAPFSRGALVLITLNSPREKFWGAVLEINPAGVSVRGIDLNSFDEVTAMLRNDDVVMASTVFFPLNRLERMELDVTTNGIPSLAERFHSKSGYPAEQFLRVGPEELA
jgi:hypothetical protein